MLYKWKLKMMKKNYWEKKYKQNTHTHLKQNAIFNDNKNLKKKQKPYMNLFCN